MEDVKGKSQFDAVQKTKYERCGGKTGGREGIGWPFCARREAVRSDNYGTYNTPQSKSGPVPRQISETGT